VSRLRFDPRRPLFVSQEFKLSNKTWTLETHFPWETFGWDYQGNEIHFYYDNYYLNHRPDLETSMMDVVNKTIGDGLEAMTIEALHDLRNTINRQVKAKAANPREYQKKACAFSRIKDKQIGKIRSWRSAYGHMEV
jgi:hypothetical protein